jgi:hypothetical protein
MEPQYSWSWVEARVGESIELWNDCAARSLPLSPRYTLKEQRKHEEAYDKALGAVQREARRTERTTFGKQLAQKRIVALFPRFASVALGLEGESVRLLTDGFLSIAAQFARWARSFDSTLSMDDIIQACRNAWTACGLQPLLGQPMILTPAIIGYSLLYPYSDNYLDHPRLSRSAKLHFSERFRQRLRGQLHPPCNSHEAAVWTMVQMIENQYPRLLFPQVYDCLLAIHQAQEQSIAQLDFSNRFGHSGKTIDLLQISCAKGGTSVLADACLARPLLTPEESSASFLWGVLLQLGDDLQDVHEDLRRGSVTLFTLAAAEGRPLDSLVQQLLDLSEHVADRMELLPHGSDTLKNLLRMSWRSLIHMAVAETQQFFSAEFLAQLEPCSLFRFSFLRSRNEKLTGRQALYATLFDAILGAAPSEEIQLPLPVESYPAPDLDPAAELTVLSNSFA